VQIRGYPVRFDIDVLILFSANPATYNRSGKVIPQLKDRIGSVVRTHYPLTREIGIAISEQNAWLDRGHDGTTLAIPIYIKEVVEEISRLARSSPHVNQQSGVSVRMSIANLENVVSNAERRAILHHEKWIVPRVSDLAYASSSSRGKLELTMAEDDGHEDKLIHRIIDEATKNIFGLHLDVRELKPIVEYFESGHNVELGDGLSTREMLERIGKVPKLRDRAADLAAKALPNSEGREAKDAAIASAAEFLLEGLHVHNKLNKASRAGGATYRR